MKNKVAPSPDLPSDAYEMKAGHSSGKYFQGKPEPCHFLVFFIQFADSTIRFMKNGNYTMKEMNKKEMKIDLAHWFEDKLVVSQGMITQGESNDELRNAEIFWAMIKVNESHVVFQCFGVVLTNI